jgi:uncharacterized lipoprotein YddW (UPF0748 family)
VDEVIVQLYRPELSGLKSELGRSSLVNLSQKVPLSIGLYTGPFPRGKGIDRLAQEVTAVQANHYAGVSFFCWETTFWHFKGSDTKGVKRAFDKLFSE